MSQADRMSRTYIQRSNLQMYDLCTFAKTTGLQLSPQSNRTHDSLKRDMLEKNILEDRMQDSVKCTYNMNIGVV